MMNTRIIPETWENPVEQPTFDYCFSCGGQTEHNLVSVYSNEGELLGECLECSECHSRLSSLVS